jgi:hypothetical protein
MINFRSVFERYEASKLNQIDAAALLGISDRTFRRWCVRFDDCGEAGLLDRRLGRAGADSAGVTDRDPVSDPLQRLHRQALPRTPGARAWIHLGLHLDQGAPAIEGSAVTCQDTRRAPPQAATPAVARPLPGMMLHQDGSRHEWIAGLDAMDLIVTMDDGTEEGTASTFQVLLEVFGRHGPPLNLYTDRGSHYFYTPEAVARWIASL